MKRPKNKEITISDLIPDMKRDIREMQKEHSEIRFYDRLLDEGCLKSRYLDEDIFEIAKEHDLSLTETEELQSFKDDNKFKDAEKAYEAWSSDN